VSRTLLTCAGILVVGHLFLWLAMPLAIEDAYIAFRYARNLVEGHGLVYNLGERVMGFTSLPWTLWCALGMALHVDPVAWTRATSLAADLATLWLGWQMLPDHARIPFAVFFAGCPMFAAGAGSGLEANAFLALIMLSAWLASRGSRWAGLALGLLAVMRPEGFVAAAVIGIAADTRSRLVAVVLVLAASTQTWAYYGSPIPQSVIAKAALYGTPGPWAGRHWWEWLTPALFSGHGPIANDFNALLPVMALFVAALVMGLREPHPSLLPAFAGVAVWLGYAITGTAYFWWYMVPPLGCLSLVAACGFTRVVRGRALPIAACVMLLGAWHVAFRFYGGRANAELLFARVAELLVGRARAGDSVFLEPIGYIGYRTGFRVVDEVGLVSPSVIWRRKRGAGWYADELADERPDWLVVRAGVISSGKAFAGTGNLFRSAEERDRALEPYSLVVPGVAIEIYRRKHAE